MRGPTGLPAQRPVDIPDNLSHGTSYVHRHYKCRCGPCQKWRREYDQSRPQKRRRSDLRKGRWYVCLGRYGLVYENHEYTRTGICVRCKARRAVEEYWERKWNEWVPTRW